MKPIARLLAFAYWLGLPLAFAQIIGLGSVGTGCVCAAHVGAPLLLMAFCSKGGRYAIAIFFVVVPLGWALHWAGIL